MFGSIDNYIREVRKKISAQKITDELKEYILEHFETVNFYGRTLLVFRVKSVPGSHYEDEKFIRHGNESKSVKGNMNSMSLFQDARVSGGRGYGLCPLYCYHFQSLTVIPLPHTL